MIASVSGKAFDKALERRGWVLLRITGSHHIYFKTGERMLLNALLKAAGISLDDLG